MTAPVPNGPVPADAARTATLPVAAPRTAPGHAGVLGPGGPRGDAPAAMLHHELQPVVGRLLERHLATAEIWLPHTLVPWSDATDFDGPLNGEPWSPEQTTVPGPVQDALLINLLTEDNLPGYHLALSTVTLSGELWQTWANRWTAEEARHGDALRAYLHARRAVDPVVLEHTRMRHISHGYAADPGHSPLHALAYVTVQELATRISHRNTGKMCGDPVGERLMAQIAADENLHMLFYRDLFAHAFQLAPDACLVALADVVCGFQMPGATMPGFQRRALRVAAAGIYDPEIHRDHVLRPLLRAWGVMELGGLGPEGEQARDRVVAHLDQLPGKAARLRRLCARTEDIADADHR